MRKTDSSTKLTRVIIIFGLTLAIFGFVWSFDFSIAQAPPQDGFDKLTINFGAEQEEEVICLVYFTGIGCPHCTKVDPIVLEQLPKEYSNLVIIEYEIYQQRENAPLIYEYNEHYNYGLGIPLIIFDKNKHIVGDRPILQNVRKTIEELKSNQCPLVDGTSANFNDLETASLPGQPKIWAGKNISLSEIETEESQTETELFPKEEIEKELTLVKIISLGTVDAVNPCALAVLTLMLIAILTYHPTKKRNVLLAGLAFVASVFVMYLIYGLVIIKSFQLISALVTVRLWLYKILGLAAIVMGCFKLKDFFRAKAVCKVTPRIDRIVSKITSPQGAFLVGALVTVFLLPCTIGPYIICGGILCPLGMLKALPWLLLYNLIFVLPMLAVVLLIYFGLRKIEDISSWQAKNIKYLHLVAGLVILGLGLGMLLGFL